MVFGENKQKRHNCNRCGDPIKNHIVKTFIGRKVGGIFYCCTGNSLEVNGLVDK